MISLVTGGRGGGPDLVERVEAAARAGIHLVQVRERRLDDRALLAFVSSCMEAVRGTAARVVVNDRLDIALSARAHGVHLRADSISPRRARALAPPGFLIGRSVHQAGEILDLTAEGEVDYFLFGTVFPSASKPGRAPAGPEHLARAAASTPVPVLAIGGITTATLAGVRAAGAAGFAAITLFADTPPHGIAALVRRATRAFEGAPGTG